MHCNGKAYFYLFLKTHLFSLDLWASPVAQLVRNSTAMQETPVRFLGQEDPLEKGQTPVFLGLPCGLVGKEFACNPGDLGLIPGLQRSPGKGKGYPFQFSGLENSVDCVVHEVAKSQTSLSDFHFTLYSIIVSLNKLKQHIFVALN